MPRHLRQRLRSEPSPRGATPVIRHLLCVLAMLSAGAIIAMTPTTAEAVPAAEQAYNQRPRARAAMAIARKYLSQGRRGKAVNWANRAANCRDATRRIRAEAARMERRLQWALYDRGFGVVEIRIAPRGAKVTLDGQLFRPAGSGFRVWLPGGSHQLEVQKPRYRNVGRIITAKAGEQRRVDVKLVYSEPPVVRFVVKPVNAEVWLAQDFLGFSVGRRFSLPVGSSLIELRAPGHVSWVRTLKLRAGERRTIEVTLDKTALRNRRRVMASTVPRRLTPIELANRGERHRLGRRPGQPRATRRAYHGSGEAPEMRNDARPNWRKVAKTNNGPPDMSAPLPSDEPPDSLGSDGNGGGGASGDLDPGFGGDVSDAGLSDASKGWVYTGIGVALLAGGVGGSLYGVSQASYANDLALGNPNYETTYGGAANLTYAGYGAAGVGLASLVAGGLYLFSEDGLSEAGRGWFLLGTGAMTSLAGTWLLMDAVATAEAANTLPPRHYAYAQRFDGAERNWRMGAITAGVGGVITLVGAWLLFSAEDGASVATSDLTSEPASGTSSLKASLLPTFGGGSSGLRGMALQLRW